MTNSEYKELLSEYVGQNISVQKDNLWITGTLVKLVGDFLIIDVLTENKRKTIRLEDIKSFEFDLEEAPDASNVSDKSVLDEVKEYQSLSVIENKDLSTTNDSDTNAEVIDICKLTDDYKFIPQDHADTNVTVICDETHVHEMYGKYIYEILTKLRNARSWANTIYKYALTNDVKEREEAGRHCYNILVECEYAYRDFSYWCGIDNDDIDEAIDRLQDYTIWTRSAEYLSNLDVNDSKNQFNEIDECIKIIEKELSLIACNSGLTRILPFYMFFNVNIADLYDALDIRYVENNKYIGNFDVFSSFCKDTLKEDYKLPKEQKNVRIILKRQSLLCSAIKSIYGLGERNLIPADYDVKMCLSQLAQDVLLSFGDYISFYKKTNDNSTISAQYIYLLSLKFAQDKDMGKRIAFRYFAPFYVPKNKIYLHYTESDENRYLMCPKTYHKDNAETKRVPILFIVDTNPSMAGERISSVEYAINKFIGTAKSRNYPLDIAVISAGKNTKVDFDFTPVKQISYVSIEIADNARKSRKEKSGIKNLGSGAAIGGIVGGLLGGPLGAIVGGITGGITGGAFSDNPIDEFDKDNVNDFESKAGNNTQTYEVTNLEAAFEQGVNLLCYNDNYDLQEIVGLETKPVCVFITDVIKGDRGDRNSYTAIADNDFYDNYVIGLGNFCNVPYLMGIAATQNNFFKADDYLSVNDNFIDILDNIVAKHNLTTELTTSDDLKVEYRLQGSVISLLQASARFVMSADASLSQWEILKTALQELSLYEYVFDSFSEYFNTQSETEIAKEFDKYTKEYSLYNKELLNILIDFSEHITWLNSIEYGKSLADLIDDKHEKYLSALEKDYFERFVKVINECYARVKNMKEVVGGKGVDEIIQVKNELDYLETEIVAYPTYLSFGLLRVLTMKYSAILMTIVNGYLAFGTPTLSLSINKIYKSETDKNNTIIVFDIANGLNRTECKNFKIVNTNLSEIISTDITGLIVPGDAAKYQFSVETSDIVENLEKIEIRLQYSYVDGYNNNEKVTEEGIDAFEIELDAKSLYQSDVFEEIINPYVAGDAVDNKDMVFGREQLINDIINQIKFGRTMSIALWGQKRTGKSTVLLQLKKALLEKEYEVPPVLVETPQLTELEPKSCNNHAEIKEKFQKMFLIEPLEKEVRKRKELAIYFKENNFSLGKKYDCSPSERLEEFFSIYNSIENHPQIIVFMDEFTALYKPIVENNLDEDFLKSWRAFLKRQELITVVVCQDFMEKLFDLSPNSFANTIRQEITYLDYESCRQLVMEPIRRNSPQEITFDDEALSLIYSYTAGNVFFMVSICVSLVNYINNNRITRITRGQAQKAIIEYINSRSSKTLFESLYYDESNFTDPGIKDDTYKLCKLLADNSIVGGCDEELIFKLATSKLGLDEARVTGILDSLKDRKVLLKSYNKYIIRVKLFEEWLKAKG